MSGRARPRRAALLVLAGASALACGPLGEGTAAGAGRPRPLDPPAARGAMAPSLALDGADVLLTWLEPAAGKDAHTLRFARLAGDRWSAPVTVAAGGDFFANWADFPAVARGRQGLVAHWLGMIGPGTYAYGIHLAGSGDGGASWRRLGKLHDDATPTEHGFVSYVREGAGVRAFWLDGRQTSGGHGEEEGPMSLRTALVAGSAGASELLDPLVCSCCQTDAAATAAGPVVVYRDRSADELRDIAIVRRTRAGWSAPATVHADGWRIPGCPVNGPAVAAAGRRVAVAWFTAAPPGPRVYVAFSEDGGARFAAPLLVDGAKPLGRVDLAMTAGGEAVVSWLALGAEPGGEGQRARVRLRRLAPRGAGAAVAIATTGATRASGFPRLMLQGDRLVLAWVEDGEPSRLRAAALPLAAVPAPA